MTTWTIPTVGNATMVCHTCQTENTMPNVTAPDITLKVLDSYAGVDVAAYRIEVSALGRTIEVEGSSKRQHDDEPNEEIGRLLAIGRAFRYVGGQLEAEGRALSDRGGRPIPNVNLAAQAEFVDVIDRRRHDKHIDHLNGIIESLEARLAPLEAAQAKRDEAAVVLQAKPGPKPRVRKATASRRPVKKAT